MSEQIEDRNLESAVKPRCESAEEAQSVIGSGYPPRPVAQPDYPRPRKFMSPRGPRRSINARLSRRRRFGERVASSEEILAACEMIFSSQAKNEGDRLPQPIPAGPEASQEFDSTINREMYSEEELIAACEMILSAQANTEEEILAACMRILGAKANAPGQGLPDEEIVAACEMILSVKAKTQEQGLPQGQPALRVGAEANDKADPKLTSATHHEPEVVPTINVLGSNDHDIPREEPEVSTNLEQRPRSKSTWSVRVVLPRTAGVGLASIFHGLVSACNWAFKQLQSRQARKRLRVCETVSLGEKRFVAVVEVDGEQFLVGGASGSVATLARLEPSPEFSEVLKRRWSQDPVQA